MNEEFKQYDFTQFRDRYPNTVCLIVGTGPGLSNIPVEFLNKYPTFSFNGVFTQMPEFVPTFYHNMGGNHLDTQEKREQIYPLIADDRCEAAFMNRHLIHYFRHPKVYSILGPRTYGIVTKRDEFVFSPSPLEVIGLAPTSIYLSMQLAVYMGFTTILLVGVDHKYDQKKPHAYESGLVVDEETPPGPFYNNDPNEWQSQATKALSVAKTVLDKNGIRVVNLSEPTELDVFERGDWRDW